MKGAPGFKIFTHNIQASAEYDIKVGDILNVVPGVSYNYVMFKDYIPDYKNPSDPNDFSWEYHDHDYKSPNGRHLSGYFDGGTAELKDFAPSLRADFHVGGFRAIAAARIRRRNAVRRILDADDSQIIYFTVKEGGNGTKTRN